MAEFPKAHRRLVPRKQASSQPGTRRKTTATPSPGSAVPAADEATRVHPASRVDSDPGRSEADEDAFAFLDEPATADRPRPATDLSELEVTVRRFALPAPPETLDEDDLDLDGIDPDDRTKALPIRNVKAAGSSEAPIVEPAAPGEPPSRFPLSSVATFGAQESRGNPRGSLVAESQYGDYDPTSLRMPDELLAPEVLPPEPGELEPMAAISPAEIGLLAAMAEGHEQSRIVYMNWLERRGDTRRAEFLRIDYALATMSAHDLRRVELQTQLRDLAQYINVEWRSRVSRGRIENCPHAAAGCPQYWRQLPAIADDVRTCGPCGHAVYYCESIDIARTRVQAGQRVVVDLLVERTVEDLSHTPCPTCQAKIPVGTRFCGHCGRSTGF